MSCASGVADCYRTAASQIPPPMLRAQPFKPHLQPAKWPGAAAAEHLMARPPDLDTPFMPAPPLHCLQLPQQVLDILPGISGGMARVMIGQPFDTIKTRLQVRQRPAADAAAAAWREAPAWRLRK